MHGKNSVAAIFLVGALSQGWIEASAQTVSGLSERPSAAAAAGEGAESIASLLELARAIADATTPEQRRRLEQTLSGLRVTSASKTGTGINLAVPAGATASVGKDQKPAAGALIGFQAWKPDDFFAGAFFTFDAAPKLNGDSRKVAQFLRNPPNSGTSVYLSGSRMFWGGGGWKFHRLRSKEGAPTSGTGKPTVRKYPVLVGLAFRAGATSVTLEHHAREAVDSRDASILYVTPSILVTSRTFEDGRDGEYQFGVELGSTFRWAGGDAALDKAFLKQPDVFGHDSTRFIGLDGTFFVRLNAFQPFVRVTHIPDRSGVHIPGLTGTQAFFGINVQSALFQTVSEKKEP